MKAFIIRLNIRQYKAYITQTELDDGEIIKVGGINGSSGRFNSYKYAASIEEARDKIKSILESEIKRMQSHIERLLNIEINVIEDR